MTATTRYLDRHVNFIGLDLAWSKKNPSGLAHLRWDGKKAWLSGTDVLNSDEDIFSWIRERSNPHACIAIDAPIIAPNPPGTRRPADHAVSKDFRRFDAGVYPANRRRARWPVVFSKKLARRGFSANPKFPPHRPVKRQIEVYPHSAMVVLFHLEKIIKYKKGPLSARWKGLRRLQSEMGRHLPALDPPVDRLSLLKVCTETPEGKRGRALKDLEDRLDAVVCAYTGLYYWYWGKKKCCVYGDVTSGYIVTPVDGRIPHPDPGHHGPAH